MNSNLARQIRRDSIRMVVHAGSGHVGGAMGAAEIFAVLYGETLNYRAHDPAWNDRDRLILSNGHICAAWYSVLSRTGHFPVEELATHRRFGSRLQGHPTRAKLGSLVETASGPLGQGLSVANGIALSCRMDGRTNRVFCLLGDGEMAEGQVWEALMTAGHYSLSNLVVVVLNNGVQIDGYTKHIKNQEPLNERLEAFGWEVLRVDGHDEKVIANAFLPLSSRTKPLAIIADVLMAKGYAPWEGQPKWHGTTPSRAEAIEALDSIGKAPGFTDFMIPTLQGEVL